MRFKMVSIINQDRFRQFHILLDTRYDLLLRHEEEKILNED
jgi:hypothetical protein